ncbi:membrane protein insertion efficiency factor YidD [Rhizobium calliandrae]|uniref:Putative membrane protein insertion efficiency factor n=1 Tax=Rhizobium calliandrae TaxID=1312182 RepID=A0ABT7KFI2_9HYPH|nr:membrane protein insertion efficiency factor YidD [Rhizobium calliandrae]MDL2407317.1 membrane protein insertion efficiency factor YidD [Rhizobium calliandrae]
MCHLCSMQDDEDEGAAAARPKRLRRDKIPPRSNSKSLHSRNYSGPFQKTPDRLLGMGLIRLYQLTLSGFIGNSCRHIPTCSEYGYESIARHGLWAGGWMTLFRVARCGPGGTSGLDPVPETLEMRYHWWTPWRYFAIGRKPAGAA